MRRVLCRSGVWVILADDADAADAGVGIEDVRTGCTVIMVEPDGFPFIEVSCLQFLDGSFDAGLRCGCGDEYARQREGFRDILRPVSAVAYNPLREGDAVNLGCIMIVRAYANKNRAIS